MNVTQKGERKKMKNWSEIFRGRRFEVLLESYMTQEILEYYDKDDIDAIRISTFRNDDEGETIYAVSYYIQLILVLVQRIKPEEPSQTYKVLWSAKCSKKNVEQEER